MFRCVQAKYSSHESSRITKKNARELIVTGKNSICFQDYKFTRNLALRQNIHPVSETACW